MKRILVVNVHSYWNAGDAALTDVSLAQLKQAFPRAEFALSMNDPGSYQGQVKTVASFTTWCKDSQNHWIWWSPFVLLQAFLSVMLFRVFNLQAKLLLNQKQFDLLRAYFDADIVVSCAGNFLYSSGVIGLPFLLAILSILFGVWSGKPLYALPQSIGPISKRWQHALIRLIIRKARIYMIRDTVSWDYVRRIQVQMAHARLIPDVAFAMPKPNAFLGRELLQAFGVSVNEQCPLLGVTVINWAGQQRAFTQQVDYELALIDALNWYIHTYNGKVVFFPQVCGPSPVEDDRNAARRVATQVDDQESVTVIDQIVDAETLASAYGHLDAFLGTRLHSCIFAMNQGVPVLAIAYQHKTQGIFAMLDFDAPVIPIAEVTAQRLRDGLHQLLDVEDYSVYRRSLLSVLDHVQEQASQAASLIAEDVCQ